LEIRRKDNAYIPVAYQRKLCGQNELYFLPGGRTACVCGGFLNGTRRAVLCSPDADTSAYFYKRRAAALCRADSGRYILGGYGLPVGSIRTLTEKAKIPALKIQGTPDGVPFLRHFYLIFLKNYRLISEP
jgi:hypothetical protein